MKEQCRNCRWMEGDYGWRPTEEYHDGTCHRRAPIGLRDDKAGTPNQALWPHVRGRDRCGDFDPFIAPKKTTDEPSLFERVFGKSHGGY